MITKIHAATLYGYSYQLVDNEGNVYSIDCVANDGITLVRDGVDYFISADAKEIGSTYKILCRPIEDVCKEIDNGEIPLLKLNKEGIGLSTYKLEFVNRKWHLLADHHKGLNVLSERAKDYLKSLHFNLDFPSGTTQNLI